MFTKYVFALVIKIVINVCSPSSLYTLSQNQQLEPAAAKHFNDDTGRERVSMVVTFNGIKLYSRHTVTARELL